MVSLEIAGFGNPQTRVNQERKQVLEDAIRIPHLCIPHHLGQLGFGKNGLTVVLSWHQPEF
jgi:hypothetical protein